MLCIEQQEQKYKADLKQLKDMHIVERQQAEQRVQAQFQENQALRLMVTRLQNEIHELEANARNSSSSSSSQQGTFRPLAPTPSQVNYLRMLAGNTNTTIPQRCFEDRAAASVLIDRLKNQLG